MENDLSAEATVHGRLSISSRSLFTSPNICFVASSISDSFRQTTARDCPPGRAPLSTVIWHLSLSWSMDDGSFRASSSGTWLSRRPSIAACSRATAISRLGVWNRLSNPAITRSRASSDAKRTTSLCDIWLSATLRPSCRILPGVWVRLLGGGVTRPRSSAFTPAASTSLFSPPSRRIWRRPLRSWRDSSAERAGLEELCRDVATNSHGWKMASTSDRATYVLDYSAFLDEPAILALVSPRTERSSVRSASNSCTCWYRSRTRFIAFALTHHRVSQIPRGLRMTSPSWNSDLKRAVRFADSFTTFATSFTNCRQSATRRISRPASWSTRSKLWFEHGT